VSEERRTAPPPLEANDQLLIWVPTAGWVIALIVLVALGAKLPSADHWWIWTAAAGTAVGLFGAWYVPRLKRSRTAAAQRRTGTQASQ
jgi:hypothetical protein